VTTMPQVDVVQHAIARLLTDPHVSAELRLTGKLRGISADEARHMALMINQLPASNLDWLVHATLSKRQTMLKIALPNVMKALDRYEHRVAVLGEFCNRFPPEVYPSIFEKMVHECTNLGRFLCDWRLANLEPLAAVAQFDRNVLLVRHVPGAEGSTDGQYAIAPTARMDQFDYDPQVIIKHTSAAWTSDSLPAQRTITYLGIVYRTQPQGTQIYKLGAATYQMLQELTQRTATSPPRDSDDTSRQSQRSRVIKLATAYGLLIPTPGEQPK